MRVLLVLCLVAVSVTHAMIHDVVHDHHGGPVHVTHGHGVDHHDMKTTQVRVGNKLHTVQEMVPHVYTGNRLRPQVRAHVHHDVSPIGGGVLGLSRLGSLGSLDLIDGGRYGSRRYRSRYGRRSRGRGLIGGLLSRLGGSSLYRRGRLYDRDYDTLLY